MLMDEVVAGRAFGEVAERSHAAGHAAWTPVVQRLRDAGWIGSAFSRLPASSLPPPQLLRWDSFPVDSVMGALLPSGPKARVLGLIGNAIWMVQSAFAKKDRPQTGAVTDAHPLSYHAPFGPALRKISLDAEQPARRFENWMNFGRPQKLGERRPA
jgi:hypothetical protein